MSQYRRQARPGFSLVELLIVIAIIAIIVSIAIPRAQHALDGADETAVIREMQTIHQAQIQYLTQSGAYASTLQQLGPKASGLIPASLASGEKNGYIFTLNLTPQGYAVHAMPKSHSSGRRNFYLDENGVVHHSKDSEATADSPEIK